MSFNYNKYSLIYQGVQSQKSRSYEEILMSVHATATCNLYVIVFSSVTVLSKTSSQVCLHGACRIM